MKKLLYFYLLCLIFSCLSCDISGQVKEPLLGREEVSTFEELKTAVESGYEEVLISSDIEISETIYVSGKTKIHASNNQKIIRGADFLGNLFIVGINSDLEKKLNSELFIENIEIDGADIESFGTIILITNSSTLELGKGSKIINAVKTQYDKTLDSFDLSYPDTVGGAAVIIENGQLNINGGVISNCRVNTSENISYKGGAIYNEGDVVMNSGIIEGCSSARGGAIFNYSNIYVNGGSIIDNYASSYGGAICFANSQYAYLYITSNNEASIFSSNSSGKSGGCIFGQPKTGILIDGENIIFSDNKSIGGNGGVINTSGDLVIKKTKFENNSATSSSGKGGAVYVYYGDNTLSKRGVRIEDSIFTDNTAMNGGAVGISASADYTQGGAEVSVTNTTFNNNSSVENGAAVYVSKASSLDISSSKLNGNNAGKNGGGIYVTGGSFLSVDNIRFEENSSENNGGALYVYTNSKASIANSSFSSNKTIGFGGAVYISGKASMILEGIDTVENTAEKGNFIYLTTTGTSVELITGTLGSLENIYINTNKAILKISKDIDISLIQGKNDKVEVIG